MKKYSEQISITIRFNINTNNEKNELAKITTRLFEIYHEKGEHSCLEAMHHIYNKRDIIDWFNLFGSSNNVLQYRNVLLKEKKWCVENQINFTPALLVNGLVYPKEYKNEDLLFFVDDLFEDTINANSNNLELEIA
ncbi:hypothetical protein BFP78_01855 [Gaetbulibacter sp. 5U11]|nr:hypothetical protein BFP78_01855 [Gaetbulibacter sp. 5U11]